MAEFNGILFSVHIPEKVLGIEGYVLERESGNLPACSFSWIVSGSEEGIPQFGHISCNDHFPDRMDDFALAEEKAFDAVGEVTGGLVAVSAVESRDKDAFAAL